MTQRANRETRQQDLEDAVAQRLNTVGSRIERAIESVNESDAKTSDHFNEAFIETVDKVKDPRLTEHMQQQLEPGILAHPDLLVILGKIDPKLLPEIIPRFDTITATDMAAEKRAVRRSVYSARNIGRSLLAGFGGGIRL